jgi:hypothetical protein
VGGGGVPKLPPSRVKSQQFRLGLSEIDKVAETDKASGWCKPTHLTSVFSLWTSVFTSPHGTTLMAFADVCMDVAGCYIGWFTPTLKLASLECYSFKCCVQIIYKIGCHRLLH